MRYEIVVMGTSLGGLTAMERILADLPAGFSAAIALVQHRSADSGPGLMRALQRRCALTVREPVDKETIAPGQVYLAPPNYHLLVEEGFFSLSTDLPVLSA